MHEHSTHRLQLSNKSPMSLHRLWRSQAKSPLVTHNSQWELHSITMNQLNDVDFKCPLSARLILTDHSPLPGPERPCEGICWSGSLMISLLRDYSCWWWSSCCYVQSVHSVKENMVLTPDWLRGKNPVGRKSALNCCSYCVCTNAQFTWLEVHVLVLG